MTTFEYFTYYILAPVVFGTGMFGNIFGIIVVSQKKLDKIGPRNMYKYLFISDTAFLLFITVNYFQYGFGYDATIISKYMCKLYWYFNYSIAPISPWLLSKYILLYIAG